MSKVETRFERSCGVVAWLRLVVAYACAVYRLEMEDLFESEEQFRDLESIVQVLSLYLDGILVVSSARCMCGMEVVICQ